MLRNLPAILIAVLMSWCCLARPSPTVVSVDLDEQGRLMMQNRVSQGSDAVRQQIKSLIQQDPTTRFIVHVAKGNRYRPVGVIVVDLKRYGAQGVTFDLDGQILDIAFPRSPQTLMSSDRQQTTQFVDVDAGGAIVLNGLHLTSATELDMRLKALHANDARAFRLLLCPNSLADYQPVFDVLNVFRKYLPRDSIAVIGDEQFLE